MKAKKNVMSEPTWDGIPQNPERDGWHWLSIPNNGYPASPWKWFTAKQEWEDDSLGFYNPKSPKEVSKWSNYHGPCLTHIEIAALHAALAVLRRLAKQPLTSEMVGKQTAKLADYKNAYNFFVNEARNCLFVLQLSALTTPPITPEENAK